MDARNPCTFELLSGPPSSAYLRAIGALSPLPPVRASTPVHDAAALHDSIELPSYTAAFDAHVFHPAVDVEVPVTDSKSKNSATLPRLSEYDADIDVNLLEMEKNTKHRPSPDYLKMLQGDQESNFKRARLVFWMEDVARYFDLAPGTLHRAVSYLDRVLSGRTLSSLTDMDYELHLLGATAVYTAAKYEERYTRFKVNPAAIAESFGFGTSEEVIDKELEMLKALRYELGGPTAYTFVERYTRHSKGGDQDVEAQQLAHHFAQLSLVDLRWLHCPPSVLAASAVFLARLILNPKANQVRQWNKDFEELTGYKPTDLILVIESLADLDPDPRFEMLQAFFQDE